MIKALIVGINRYPNSPLQGCINDAEDVIEHLTGTLGVPRTCIAALYDGAATKRAIVTALRDLVAQSRPGDHLLFHYSGHGSQLPALSPPLGELAQPEPDGLDEILCPVDFSWSDRSTALTDNELRAILDTVAGDRRMTVTLDSCHSGDMIREAQRDGGVARWLPPPPDVERQLRVARGRGLRSRGTSTPSNVTLVSACKSTETAADTSFNGRPNGAFTYHWLAEVKARASASLEALVVGVTRPLDRFSMHPALEGSEALAKSQFLTTAPRAEEPLGSVNGQEPMQLLFDERWAANVFGLDLRAGLQIALVDGTYEFQLSSLYGLPRRRTFAVRGDANEAIDLGSGLSILLSVSGWRSLDGETSFELAISVKVPFFRPVTITEQRVVLSRLREVPSEPLSSAELVAKLQLAERVQRAQPSEPSQAREGEAQFTGIAHIEPFAGGFSGARYNRNTNAYVPPGFVRSHVEVTLDPPASGNVYFVQWEDSDLHIGRFQFHVGCRVFGGGVATFYLHCVRERAASREDLSSPAADPVVQAVKIAALALSNGDARKLLSSGAEAPAAAPS